MVSETTLQKIVSKQREMLTELLFESMSELAAACANKMQDRDALEDLLAAEMANADYCKYLWVGPRPYCSPVFTTGTQRRGLLFV